MAITGDVHIKVNSAALMAKADSVSKSIARMSDCFDRMEAVVNRTSYYWVGEAASQNRKLYREKKPQVEVMMKRLREHPGDLVKIAQTYETAEAQVKAAASELPGDVIS